MAWPRRFGNKFNNTRCVCAHDHNHASRIEARRCDFLYLLKRGKAEIYGGRVMEIVNQPTLDLAGVCRYRPDFGVRVSAHPTPRGITEVVTVYEDVKGFETPEFRIKRRLFDKLNSDNPLRVVKLIHGRWVTT